jgi:hypothetical protein
MMKKATLFIHVFILISVVSCNRIENNINCNQLPNSFLNYAIAVKTITSTQFEIHETVNTSKSSWILTADFYSCDKVKGYFMYTTKGGTYTHKNMPIQVWDEFKKADSYGNYYNRNIKNRYQFYLKN